VNPSTDRVAVPTNGHRPALSDDALEPSGTDDALADTDARPAPTASSVTPGQVIAGFGILAALILLVLGRRRGRGD
jgi:hypothetical protein